MDKCLEHVDAADRTDAGTVKLRFTETAPIPQHCQDDTPSVFLLACDGIRIAVRLSSAAGSLLVLLLGVSVAR